jgi:DNA-binding IclR family transcriptional regulator
MSTLANAMQVLQLVTRLRRDITLGDLSTHLGMPKSSASRTLSQMCTYGFLERDPASRTFRPGRVLLEASYHFRGSHGALDLIEAQLDHVVSETGYTTYIDLLDGADSLVIQMRIGAGSLQVYTPPGTRLPAHATSVGRAILARLPDDQVLKLIGHNFPGKRTKANGGPATPRQLLSRLAEVRKQGWSLSRGELIDNVAGVSTAIMDPSTHQVYGLSIALPAQDLDDARIEKFSQLLVGVALGIGHQIGDPYWQEFRPPAASPVAPVEKRHAATVSRGGKR